MPKNIKELGWGILLHTSKVAGVVTAFIAILSTIWFFMQNEVEDYARNLVGYKNITVAIEEQGIVIESIDAKVDNIELRVESLEPDIIVAEYDQLRSKTLFSTCAIGSICEYSFRVRRTPTGVACKTPSPTRYLVDSSGLTYFPKQGSLSHPARLSHEWTVVSSSFVVPSNANLGVAEFYLLLRYEGCETGIDNEVIENESFHLIFNIIAESTILVED